MPQFGHTRWDSFGLWHCGHSLTLDAGPGWLDRRASLRAREVFLLGTAIRSPHSLITYGETECLYPIGGDISRGGVFLAALAALAHAQLLEADPALVDAIFAAATGLFVEIFAAEAA